MKKAIIIFFIIILLIFLSAFFAIYYPHSILSVGDDIIYDEAYFISKFADNNLQLFAENMFVITEDELNGFITYRNQDSRLLLQKSSPLHVNHVEVELLQGEVLLTLYGKLYFAPMKIEVQLIPAYREGSLFLKLKGAKLSRAKIPVSLLNYLLKDLYTFNNGTELILPINTPDTILVKDIQFEENQIILYYQINREKVLEQLLKEMESIFN